MKSVNAHTPCSELALYIIYYHNHHGLTIKKYLPITIISRIAERTYIEMTIHPKRQQTPNASRKREYCAIIHALPASHGFLICSRRCIHMRETTEVISIQKKPNPLSNE
jgi:hypothetical protein